MRKLLNLFLALVLLAVSGVLHAAPRVNHVFIISIDGGKPAVLLESKMPTLFSLARKGAFTWDAQTIKPSITLVSHTSMLTGVDPAKHHILWNGYDPSKGVVQVPTVFSLAKKADPKLQTSMIFGKEKFIHLTIPGSLDTFALGSYQSLQEADIAAAMIRTNKPNLCFIHFAAGDGAGHGHGWGSPEQIAAFADVDKGLKTIMTAIRKAGFEKDSVVIISADHGGHDKTHGTDSPEDMTIPWVAYGKGVRAGFQIATPVTTYDTAATALWLLDVPIPKDFDGKPVKNAFEF